MSAQNENSQASTRKGTEHIIDIEATAFKGKGVGKIGELVVFVPGTAPGDRVKVRIIKKKKAFREAKLLEILQPSALRIAPKCQHAHVCGGCSWQHLTYQDQLRFKTQQVRDHMQRIAKTDTEVQEAIGSEQVFHYRNKMEYSFGTKRWLSKAEMDDEAYISDEGFFGGLHAPGRFDKILPLEACYLQDERSFQILDWTRKYALDHGLDAYNTFTHSGYLRHLTIRNAFHTADFMVNLVTSEDRPETMTKFTEALLSAFPSITTVVNNIHSGKAQIAVGSHEKVYHGTGSILDKIGNFSFEIHPNAFFQTNTKQAEVLYDIARNFAQLKPTDIVYDLYCGVGTLTLFMAEYAKFVLGIELNPVSVKNAGFNAQTNEVKNVAFVEGDMSKAFNTELIKTYGSPDVLITDPPRAGMHPDVVKHLIELKIPKIVYVSCNSSTMARDLHMLQESYHIEAIQPVDMFPQTYHIETVAKLTLKK